MAKVFGIHTITLRPKMTEEAFEKFVVEEFNKAPQFPGWKINVGKGDKGDRKGRYLIIIEIESVEARDFGGLTADGEIPEGAKRWGEAHPEAIKVWEKFNTFIDGWAVIFTDYVVIE